MLSGQGQGSGGVPVGAGVVMGWVGLGLRGRRHPLWSPVVLPSIETRALGLRGDDIHKGHHPTSLPLPPLRGSSRFPCLFAKTLYLKRATTGAAHIKTPMVPIPHPGHSLTSSVVDWDVQVAVQV